MCRPRRRRDALDVEFGPSLQQNVEDEGLASHRVLSGVSGGSSEEDHLVLVNHRNGVSEPGLRNILGYFEGLVGLAEFLLGVALGIRVLGFLGLMGFSRILLDLLVGPVGERSCESRSSLC